MNSLFLIWPFFPSLLLLKSFIYSAIYFDIHLSAYFLTLFEKRNPNRKKTSHALECLVSVFPSIDDHILESVEHRWFYWFPFFQMNGGIFMIVAKMSCNPSQKETKKLPVMWVPTIMTHSHKSDLLAVFNPVNVYRDVTAWRGTCSCQEAFPESALSAPRFNTKHISNTLQTAADYFCLLVSELHASHSVTADLMKNDPVRPCYWSVHMCINDSCLCVSIHPMLLLLYTHVLTPFFSFLSLNVLIFIDHFALLWYHKQMHTVGLVTFVFKCYTSSCWLVNELNKTKKPE